MHSNSNMYRQHQSSSYQIQQSSYYKAYEPYYSVPVLPPPLLIPSQRRTGRVKFFNLSKGYGFIIPTHTSDTFTHDTLEEEVFVHHTSILSSSKGCMVGLNKGDEVEYDLCDGPKGIYALYVTGPKGVPIQFNPYYHNCGSSEHSTSSSPTTLQHQEYHHAKSVIAYHQPLYQPPYVTYIIPSMPPQATTTTTSHYHPPQTQQSNSSSYPNLIAYY